MARGEDLIWRLYLFAKAITNDKPIKVFNNGNLERDFTYVDDIVEGIIKVTDGSLKNKLTNQSELYSIYNIGNGNPVKLMDFIITMETALNKKAQKNFMEMQPGDVLKTFADVDALKKDFGYAPNTSLKDGIKEFVQWFNELLFIAKLKFSVKHK